MDQISAVVRELHSRSLSNDSTTGESSSNSSSPFPLLSPSMLPSILRIFVPGYAVISAHVSELLGFDVTLAVTIGIAMLAMTKGFAYLKRRAETFFHRWFTHSLTFGDTDWIYDWTMDWFEATGRLGSGRSEIVEWDWKYDEVVADMEDAEFKDVIAREQCFGRPLNLKYKPSLGDHYFWYKRRLFRLALWKEGRLPAAKISCVWISLNPLKVLLKDILLVRRNHSKTKTRLLRPKSKEQRSGSEFPWREVSRRPSRPLSTVILEKSEKERVLMDVYEYLKPQTSRWYEARGIPYRRGYLFHGPPGTGKTSLAFCIAGFFGLDVYCVSLQEPTITEEGLVYLFDKLPRGCVVVLEDIDSAGIVKRDSESKEGSKAGDDDSSSTLSSEAAASDKSSGNASSKGSKNGISLSGLLNVIDGLASAEGRVLIMTTNHPEMLDHALIRPGRIDVKVEFTLTTKEQIGEIFSHMYDAKDEKKQKGGLDRLATKSHSEEIRKLADTFSAATPENSLSPAQIQGYLLNHKNEPKDAIDGVQAWVLKTLNGKV